MKKMLLGILVLGLMPFAAAAQDAAAPETNPVSNMVKLVLARSSKNIVAAAEEMPADKYSYSPTPEQMTFGHLVIHITNFNNLVCSKLSGTAAADTPKLADTDPKDKLVPALKASFDFCTQATAKLDDTNLGDQMVLFGDHKVSRAAVMIIYVSSFADHYGTEAMYLRLNKLTPPTAEKPKSGQ